MLTTDDLNVIDEVFCFSPYGKEKENRYLHNKEVFFEENSNFCLSTDATDEFNKILENSKVLLKNDCALGLTKLCAYLKQQKDILTLSQSKFLRDKYSYQCLFTFVAKVALFDIDQAFLLRKPLSRYHKDMNQYATDLEINSWNAIQIIDTFKLLDDFKTGIYVPKRESIRNSCVVKQINVNTHSPQGDGSSSGCFFIVIGLLGISIIASFL